MNRKLIAHWFHSKASAYEDKLWYEHSSQAAMGQCECLQRKSSSSRPFRFIVTFFDAVFKSQLTDQRIIRHNVEDPRISSRENCDWGKPNIISDTGLKTKDWVRAVFENKRTRTKTNLGYSVDPKIFRPQTTVLATLHIDFAMNQQNIFHHFFSTSSIFQYLVRFVFLSSSLTPRIRTFSHSRTVQIVLPW